MKIYIYEHNTGPSWISDPIHTVGIYPTLEKALEEIPENVKRYAKNDARVHPSVKDFKPVWAAEADGWWWAIFEFEIDLAEPAETLRHVNRRVAKFEIEVLLDDVPGWGYHENDWIEQFKHRCIPSHYFHSVKHVSTEKKLV